MCSSDLTSDKLARAARAAARAVALLPAAPASESALDAVACRAVRSELGLGPDVACDERWTITIDAYPTPAALLAGAGGGDMGVARGGDDPPAGENGDMILVRIGTRAPVPLGWLLSDANAADDDPLRVVAIGVARNERAVE